MTVGGFNQETDKATKTNKSSLSAYIGTVRLDLCSKSKGLAKQAFTPQGTYGFVTPLKSSWHKDKGERNKSLNPCVLTVGGFRGLVLAFLDDDFLKHKAGIALDCKINCPIA